MSDAIKIAEEALREIREMSYGIALNPHATLAAIHAKSNAALAAITYLSSTGLVAAPAAKKED